MRFTDGDTMECELIDLTNDTTSTETVSNSSWNEEETDYNIFIGYAQFAGPAGANEGLMVRLANAAITL